MNFLIEPWKHQLKAIERADSMDHFALFFEPGTGKTGTVINMLRSKFNEQKRILRTLILCPPIVIRNWKDEWAKHSRVDPESIILLTGTGKERLEKFTAATPGSIFVTNYESLLMPALFEAIQKWQPEVLVCDESHKCKDPTAKRTKLAVKLANGQYTKKGEQEFPPADFRYILSGSPILNSPMDIFSQFLILDGGRTFGSNFFAFRAKYFYDRNAGMPRHKYFPDWRIAPGALEEINRMITLHGMYVEKKTCLDLPPFVQKTIFVTMDPVQARMYRQMKEEFVTFMEREGRDPSPVTATLAITKALRMMQITSGFVKTADGVEIPLEANPKLDALRELLEEHAATHKIIVWAVFKKNYEAIEKLCESLGIKSVQITGDTPPGKRFSNVDLFNNDPNYRVMIGHPGAGGEGVNLVVSDIAVWYSRNFSLAYAIQAAARNYRGGSEIHDSITQYDLTCENTIEELVLKKLANKVEISDKVLRDLSLELKNQES